MKQYCHYHPTSSAIWHCASCQRHYDKLCMPDGDEKQGLATCPHCHTSMLYLEKRHDMPPFWKIRSRFFTLPFKPEVLVIMILSTLGALSFNLHLVLATIAGTLITLLLVNYAVSLARHIARDKKGIPGLGSLFDFRHIRDSLAVGGLLVFSFVTPVLLLNYVHGAGALLFSLLTLPLLPSLLLMLLFTDKAVSHHKNMPPNYLQIIKKMNLAYLALIAYIASSYLLILVLSDIAQQFLPKVAWAPCTTLIGSYFLFTLFALLGYVLRRYESFATPSHTQKRKLSVGSTSLASNLRTDADLDIALKDGEYLKAISILEESVKRGGRSDLRVHQLYKLLIEHKDFKRLERYSQLIIELLLGRGQKLPAYEFVTLLRDANPEFCLFDIELSNELAEQFYEMKEYALVLWLAKDAHSRFEPSQHLAKLYLLTAKVLLSKSKTPEKARGYLDYIQQHFPETEQALASQKLLEHLAHR